MRADTQKIQLCLENYLFDDRNIFMPMIDVFLRKFFISVISESISCCSLAYLLTSFFLRKLNFRTFLFSLTRYISSRLGQWIVDDCDLVLALNASAVRVYSQPFISSGIFQFTLNFVELN